MSDLFSRIVSGATGGRGGDARSRINRLVIGPDDGRVIVRDVEVSPWRPFCCLKINFTEDPRLTGFGTGLLIRPRVILTAAHNLFSLETKNFAKSITAMVGVKSEAPAAQARVKRVEVCPGYNTSLPGRGYHRDFGIAVVDSDALHQWAGESVNVADQAPLDNGEFTSSILNVAGYPDEKPRDPDGAARNPELKTDAGAIIPSSLSEANFRYRMDTMPGQSGCPVFKYIASSKRFLFAGVHVAGDRHSETNLARRYDNFMRNQVKAWLATHG